MKKVKVKIKIVMIKIKTHNKIEKNQLTESSGLFPLISNPGADTLTGTFSMHLSLLKVGMLGCVAMDVAPLYQTALGGLAQGV
jgi:hypothetical protein